MAWAYTRGHKIEWDEAAEVWHYADTGEVAEMAPGEFGAERPCRYCHLMPTPEGHDACLGELPGVKYACCGHGIEGEGYIYYERWPLWMTNKNRWPQIIFIVGSLPWALMTVWILYGLVVIPGFLVADYSGRWLVAAFVTAVSQWLTFFIYSKQVATAEFLRQHRREALIKSLEAR